MTRLIVFMGCVGLLLASPGLAARPVSDARRLARGLEAGFRRTEIYVYPLVDQRLLGLPAEKGPTVDSAPPAAWDAFVSALEARENLRVHGPDATRRSITRRRGYDPAVQAVRTSADAGYRFHREVLLEAAAEQLESAVDGLIELEQHVVDPREVARAAVTRGLALLEAGKAVPAAAAFRKALLIDPSLRLRPGYDRPDAVAAFEQVREELARDPDEPPDFGRQTSRYEIRARAVADEDGEHIEVLIQRPGGIVRERLPLGDSPEMDGSRLASRVWACLPFGRRKRQEGHRQKLYLDAGFSYFVFLESPVEVFDNLGVGLNASWVLAPHLSLDASAALTNSGRDEQEDLRADIPVFRASLGPAFDWTNDRLRLGAGLAMEIASIGRVVTTSNAACKYFSDQEAVPRTVCDFDRHVDRVDPTLFIGPALNLTLGVRLVDQIYLSLRANVTTYVFEADDRSNGLGLPVGGQVSLGYQLL